MRCGLRALRVRCALAGRARLARALSSGSPRRDTSASASVGSSHKPPAPPPDGTPKPGTSRAPTLPAPRAPSCPTIASGCRHPRCRRRDPTGTRITSEFFSAGPCDPRLPLRSRGSFSRQSATRRSAGFPITRARCNVVRRTGIHNLYNC